MRLPDRTPAAGIDREVLDADLSALVHHRYSASVPEGREICLLVGSDAEVGCSSGELELGVDVELRISVAQVRFNGAFAQE
jgi:hypothetical protein